MNSFKEFQLCFLYSFAFAVIFTITSDACFNIIFQLHQDPFLKEIFKILPLINQVSIMITVIFKHNFQINIVCLLMKIIIDELHSCDYEYN